MREDIQNKMDDVIMDHLEKIEEDGVAADNAGKLVSNLRSLYSLRQKDEETENNRERWTYDNGRADEEFRLKEHELELNQRKFDFEQKRYEIESELRRESNQIEREKLKATKIGEGVRAISAGAGLVFNTWLSSKVLMLEETGVVGSFIAKKVFGSMLGKANDKI